MYEVCDGLKNAVAQEQVGVLVDFHVDTERDSEQFQAIRRMAEKNPNRYLRNHITGYVAALARQYNNSRPDQPMIVFDPQALQWAADDIYNAMAAEARATFRQVAQDKGQIVREAVETRIYATRRYDGDGHSPAPFEYEITARVRNVEISRQLIAEASVTLKNTTGKPEDTTYSSQYVQRADGRDATPTARTALYAVLREDAEKHVQYYGLAGFQEARIAYFNRQIEKAEREARQAADAIARLTAEKEAETPREDEPETCSECGAELDDAGDGYDGKCPDCADKAENPLGWFVDVFQPGCLNDYSSGPYDTYADALADARNVTEQYYGHGDETIRFDDTRMHAGSIHSRARSEESPNAVDSRITIEYREYDPEDIED